jgi:hypothetical protein
MDAAQLPDLDTLDREALKALIRSHQEELSSQLAARDEELRRLEAELESQRKILSEQSQELRSGSEQIEHLRLVIEKLRRMMSWRQQCKDPSPEAFIFPGRRGPFMDSSNFRKRVLHKLAEELELPKLTFQVIRRTIATLGKTKGHVKDIQGMMRHSKASTTTDVYMQSLEDEVRTAINRSLRNSRAQVLRDPVSENRWQHRRTLDRQGRTPV